LGLPIPFQGTPLFLGTPFLTLAEWQWADKSAELPKPVSEDVGALAYWITNHVNKDDILLTDDGHLGAHLFVLTGRRTSTGLWEEVMTDDLKQKLAEVLRTRPGYIILSVGDQAAPGPAEKVVQVAAFGRFRVFHRSP
jgi:hypothetical protein